MMTIDELIDEVRTVVSDVVCRVQCSLKSTCDNVERSFAINQLNVYTNASLDKLDT